MTPAAGEILGRAAELGAVDAYLARSISTPGALVIAGEPGIGKTTVWTELVRRAEDSGTRILRCRPVETEARLSFSGLADLVEAVPSEAFEALPLPQRRALDAALLRADPAEIPADPHAVAVAFRSLLIWLAESSPVLVAVDDAQWLDTSSAGAIGFAWRRITTEPIGIAASVRAGAKLPAAIGSALSEAERVDLAPLSVGAVHELLKLRLGRSLPRPLLLRVHAAARGNPFYALEIGREILREGASSDRSLPVPDDLRRLLRKRISRLSRPAREALLVAAAAGQPSRTLLAAVLGDDPSAALEEAELAEVVEMRGGRVRFTHPLYAAAIYGTAPRERRRRLHERLATAVDDLEEQARHLALAADSPSEQVASVLDRAAGQAHARGATDAAAELFAHAANLTPPGMPEQRHRRERARAECLFEAGSTTEAREVLEGLTASLPAGHVRADALLLLATILWFDSEADAPALALQALDEAGDDRRLKALIHARLAWMTVEVNPSAEHARAALDLLQEDEDPALYAFALLNWAQGEFQAGRGPHAADIERGRVLQGADVRWEYSTIPACWLKEMDRLHEARSEFEEYVRRAIDQGDDGSLAQHLVHLSEISLWLGEVDRAEGEARESLALVEQTGQPTLEPVALALNATIDALRGRMGDAQARLDRARGLGNAFDQVFVDASAGFLGLSAGEPEVVDAALSRADAHLERLGLVEPARWRFHPDHIEAVLALGDLPRADKLLARLRHRAEVAPRPWLLAVATRCDALLHAARDELPAALDLAEAALREHESLPMPFELGRTLLVKGQIERRLKRKAAATASLGLAVTIFDASAALWAVKARAELARVGLRPIARDELTETERRVAELAASGLKNREVASQLFISPKTVEANLHRAYRKLGIRSRAELGALLASGGHEPTQT